MSPTDSARAKLPPEPDPARPGVTPSTPLSGGCFALPSLSFLAAGPCPPGTPRKGSSYAPPHPDRNLVPFRSLSALDLWPRASNDQLSGAAPLATCPSMCQRRDTEPGGAGVPGSEQDENRLEEFLPRGLWPPTGQVPRPGPPAANTHQLRSSQRHLPRLTCGACA